MNLKKINKNGGMTAIDLIVSLSILSILSAIVLASLLVAKQKSRDAIRTSDMKAVHTALELYYNDHNNIPPPTENGGLSVIFGEDTPLTPSFPALLQTTYLPSPPIRS